MRVLVGCEYSGRVRQAFRNIGHDAWSCDLLESEDGSPFHIQGDVIPLLSEDWDLAIFHPPCTHLAVSGSRHFAAKKASGVQDEALEFVRALLSADIPRIALENPISIISTRIRKPDQTIQPWMFGEDASKATCLWLKGLDPLVPTVQHPGQYGCKCGHRFDVSLGKYGCPNCCGDSGPAKIVYSNQSNSGQNKLAPSPDRWKERSRTYLRVAEAMADQWGAAPELKIVQDWRSPQMEMLL